MTKKHFEEIAKAINLLPLGCSGKDKVNLAERIADVCSKGNPNFDRRKFLEAACSLD